MRLIDKESFKNNILDKQMYLISTQDGVFCYYVAVLDAIEFEPEVKAIPIKWIEKKLNCCDNINAEIFVKALIRDWEEENGRS